MAPACPRHLGGVSLAVWGQHSSLHFLPRRSVQLRGGPWRQVRWGDPPGSTSPGGRGLSPRGRCAGTAATRCLCCRSSRSPSQSWCSPRRAAARTACSTQVREPWGRDWSLPGGLPGVWGVCPGRGQALTRSTSTRTQGLGAEGERLSGDLVETCPWTGRGGEEARRSGCREGEERGALEAYGRMCFRSQGRSRTPGSLWTPSQGRSRPLSRQRPRTGCAPPVPCSTSAVPVSQSSSPFICPPRRRVLGCLPAPWGHGLPRGGCVTPAASGRPCWKWQGAERLGFPSSMPRC